MQNLSTIVDLYQKSLETQKSKIHPLINRLLWLILTLPVLTTTTKIAFSTMKIGKTRLYSRMEYYFLTNYLIVYIEKQNDEVFTIDSIIDDFNSMKEKKSST